MKIKDIYESSTTSGSITTVAAPMSTQKRSGVGKGVYANEKAGNLLTGKKTSKKYANSVNEGFDGENVNVVYIDGRASVRYTNIDDAKEAVALMKEKHPKKNFEIKQEMREAKLEEDDLIIIPGQGRNRMTGFIKHDPDKAEHEGETLKNSLHTIIRVATHLNKALSTSDNFPEWVSEKIGSIKSDMVSVMDYLISSQEMTGGVIAGGEVGESAGDIVKKVFKHKGKPFGEVGIDPEYDDQETWYMKCYPYGIDNSGYDSYEEAVAELKHCLSQVKGR